MGRHLPCNIYYQGRARLRVGRIHVPYRASTLSSFRHSSLEKFASHDAWCAYVEGAWALGFGFSSVTYSNAHSRVKLENFFFPIYNMVGVRECLSE